MSHDSRVSSEASSDRQIDKICDAYESVWSKGERPQINGFLERCDEACRAELFYELLLVELEFRRNQGERPTLEEYLRDFPQFAEQIEAADFHSGGLVFATTTGTDDVTVANRNHQPGSRIDHFELVERLGAGAMGEVWKAQDTRLRRFVAIKLPRAETLTEADLRRFLREGQAAAQLRHPRLAAVHQVGREGKSVFIVADFVDGDNLKTYLTAHSLSHVEMAELCAEVAEALHHAHEQEIVHRDLKPANIIVDRAGKPHVIDFGLAKWSNDDRDLTLHGELLGTPAYMSPEQAGGNAAKLDRRTDVYSLGVILYEFLCGQCPFTGEMGSVIHQIIAVEPPPVRKLNVKVPRDLETICIKALEKNPDRRYATMQEMAVDLRRFARGEPILSRRPGPLERSWRWIRRHPGVSAAMLVIVLILSTSGSTIYSLIRKNYQAQGYRQVLLADPSGGRVAFVPIDRRTGEPDPNPAGIVRVDTIPTTIWMKPGKYFKESILTRSDRSVDLAEEYVTIPEAGMTSEVERLVRRQDEQDEDLYLSGATMLRSENVTRNMVAVPISESLRRRNPLLPSLLYVDAEVTLPDSYAREVAKDSFPSFTHSQAEFLRLKDATSTLLFFGKRLPSASECEAIQQAILEGVDFRDASGRAVRLNPGPAPSAVWTSTNYLFPGRVEPNAMARLHDQHVLMVTGDPDVIAGATRIDGQTIAQPDVQSKWIGFRGVRSGAPRFVKP